MTTSWIPLLSVVVGGYVIGSIPTAQLIASRFGVRDLRQVGDGNPGYWNAMRQVGARRASLVFAADATKGVAAAMLAIGVGRVVCDSEWWWAYVGGAAAMVGHMFPLFARFRGGVGLLCLCAALVVAAPWVAMPVSTVGAVVLIAGRDGRVAAHGWFAAVPVVQVAVGDVYAAAATGGLMTLFAARFLATARRRSSMASSIHDRPPDR